MRGGVKQGVRMKDVSISSSKVLFLSKDYFDQSSVQSRIIL